MQSLLDAALELIRQGRSEKAAELLRDRLAGQPNDADALSVLAVALGDLDRWEAAHAAADRAIELAPENSYCWYVRAHLCYNQSKEGKTRLMKKAHHAINEAVRLEPTNSHYGWLLASIETQLKKFRKALKTLDRAQEHDPADTDCLTLRVELLRLLGRRREADAVSLSALSHDPDRAATHATRGWVLLDAGKPREAKGHFVEALRLNPGSDWSRIGFIESIRLRDPLYRLARALVALLFERSGLVRGTIIVVLILSRVGALFLYFWFLILTTRGIADLRVTFDSMGRQAQDPKDRTYSRAWYPIPAGVILGGLVAVTWQVPALSAAIALLSLTPLIVFIRLFWERLAPRIVMAAYLVCTIAVGIGAGVARWRGTMQDAVIGACAFYALVLCSGILAGFLVDRYLRPTVK